MLFRGLAAGVLVLLLWRMPVSVSEPVRSWLREAILPLQRAVDSSLGAMRDYAGALGRIPRLLSDNESLRRELSRLETEKVHWQALSRENDELRRLLGLRPLPHASWIPAKVQARSRDAWWQTARLDKGSDDGIAVNMPVLSPEGLIGKITDVTRSTSDVLLLSDPTFTVSTRIVRTGSFGVVSGRGPSWQGQVFCRMNFIPKNDQIASGDEVVTSGLGGVFPENIPVGVIDQVAADDSGLYQLADVVTRADLGSLRYVFVMRVDSPAPEPAAP